MEWTHLKKSARKHCARRQHTGLMPVEVEDLPCSIIELNSDRAIRCCIGKEVQHDGKCIIIRLREIAISTDEWGQILAVGIVDVHGIMIRILIVVMPMCDERVTRASPLVTM